VPFLRKLTGWLRARFPRAGTAMDHMGARIREFMPRWTPDRPVKDSRLIREPAWQEAEARGPDQRS
jgi:hypothetical protein